MQLENCLGVKTDRLSSLGQLVSKDKSLSVMLIQIILNTLFIYCKFGLQFGQRKQFEVTLGICDEHLFQFF